MSEMQRIIVFKRKKIGKVYKRYVDNMKIYFSYPVKGIKPLFEARISKETAKIALRHFNINFDDKDKFLIISGENIDEKLRRFIIFSGTRQTVSELLGRSLLEVITSMGEIEVLFWYSRFINAYEGGSYWDVYRAAKSLKLLYRIQT